ncbi:MAG: protein phosphatase 2C domain-containing protein [Burkholderiales bacterium]|nr:protein phosphatase 2C domain-containing protein [Burkholderiales bacterium]
MKFAVFQQSRQGGRKYNQDRVAYSYSKDAVLLVVADGMGGHYHGEVAAQITVQMIADMFQKHARPHIKDPHRFLSSAMISGHEAILDYTAKHHLMESPRTTCVAAIVQQDHAYWAHVGDSRLYMFRGMRMVTRTKDHSKVQQMFDEGKISAEELHTHPERNKIYNCLGGFLPPDVELGKRMPIRDGDSLMLCSDGVWGVLSEAEIASILDTYTITRAIPELLDHAEFRGGEEGDNLTAVGLTWGEPQKRGLHQDTVSTAQMPLADVTTRLDPFSVQRDPASRQPVTEDDIERTIAEIQTAIKKYSK